MGNYFNELHWKIIRATIFFNSYTKSPYNSGSESPWRKRDLNPIWKFRYQIKVSSKKFRKGFAKFMMPIALFKKFLS